MADESVESVKAFFERRYAEVHAIAERALRQEWANHTLRATDIVGLTFERLNNQRNLAAADEKKLLGAAAVTIRRILIDHARKRDREPPDALRIPLDSALVVELPPHIDWLEVDEALDEIEKVKPLARQVAELRMFAQCTNAEAAEALGVSTESARTALEFAQAWLHRRLRVRER